MKLVKLNEQQMATLNKVASAGVKRFVYPAFGVNFGFPDQQ